MDSITQAALGAAMAGMVAGKRCSPKVLLAGAALGTLPDLDVLIDYGDPVANMVNHRGFSHSLFVLFPLSFLIVALWLKFTGSKWPYYRLVAVIVAALVTHPLLDSFTSYGTQLFWPLPVDPVALSTIFIIDPAYTVPLLVTVLGALIWRQKAARLCGIGVGLATVYLCWSVVAYLQIQQRVEDNLAGTHLESRPVFISPTPMNTFLWRVVVLDDEQYREGLASLLDSEPDIEWQAFTRGAWPFPEKNKEIWDLERFTGGFLRFESDNGQVIATDLRLGMASYHPFRFVLARENSNQVWQMVTPEQLDPGPVLPRTIPALWLRLLGYQSIDAMLCNENDCYRDG